jgi:hypothetical protein
MATTPASKKAKGNRLERKIAEMYRRYDIDKKATRMPMSGAMTHFKGDILKPNDYAYVDECKNQERVELWKWWEQAQSQASGAQIPLLHISGNNRPILTVMSAEAYFDLRREILDLYQIIREVQERRKKMGRAKVIEVIGVDKKDNYIRTYVLLSDGTEAQGYGKFSVGDEVIYFYDQRWDVIKVEGVRNDRKIR